MVAVVNKERIGWISPAPLWSGFGDLSDDDNRDAFARPAILRFGHDEFMDELMAVLAYSPNRLSEWKAIPETWEKPAPTPAAASPLDVTEPVSTLSADLRRLASDETPESSTTTDVVAQSNGDDDFDGVLPTGHAGTGGEAPGDQPRAADEQGHDDPRHDQREVDVDETGVP